MYYIIIIIYNYEIMNKIYFDRVEHILRFVKGCEWLNHTETLNSLKLF